MKFKFIYFLVISLAYVAVASAQEQFVKKFDISFNHTPLDSVFFQLARKQERLGVSLSGPRINHIYITLDLKNVTFDQAMDSILAKQSTYKDYCVEDNGFRSLSEMTLSPEKLASRYYLREKNTGKFYHVGDILPDSTYSISNYADKTIRLAHLNKKLIILDLWGINCSSCIESMPEMEFLQEKFKDQVQIILVTKDSQQQVELLKKHVKIVRDTKLSFINGENALASLFDNRQVPRVVWIDGNSNKIVYNTYANIRNEKYIRDFLAGKRMDLKEPKELPINISDDPISQLNFVSKGDFAISSYLAPHFGNDYNYADHSGGPDLDTARIKRLTDFRTEFNPLYKSAYRKSEIFFNNSRIIKEFKNPLKYDPDRIFNKNIYDYQLLTKRKEITVKQFYRIMQSELDAFFNVNSRLDQRMIPCYIFKRSLRGAKLKKPAIKNDNGNEYYLMVKNNTLRVYNNTLAQVILNINYKHEFNNPPLIDETGIDPKLTRDWIVNIDFEHHMDAVKKSFAAYGISVTKELRKMECIVLQDAK